ncbi:MAG: glutathione transferase GstA [Myxococcota bacterium]
MKLYMLPGACSLSPHIVLRELGLPFELDKVDPKAGRTSSGEDYKAISPLGYVPALRLDGGQVLTEGVAIVQYLADQKPETKLAPAAGTFERYRLAEWLNFIATELHKGFSPLFNPSLPEPVRAATLDRLGSRLAHVDRHLDGRPYLLGDAFTVSDAYLFTIATWLPHAKLDLAKWPHLSAHHERVKARPAVKEALRVEAELRAQ